MILHLDADAFYASVEQAADRRLRGRPIVVGGESRGVVASASYEARRHGIRAAMPVARARKLCPGLIVLPGDFEKYERFSRFLFSYAYDFTPLVEVASIDEAYVDLRPGNAPSAHRQPPAREIARTIQKAVHQALRLTISEGLAANKIVSEIAGKLHKPAGFLEIPPGEERAFLAPLTVERLPGIGPRLAATLRQAGILLLGELAALSLEPLTLLAGNRARELRALARGEDTRPIVPDAPMPKSWSEQETFAADTTDDAWVLAKLRSMADRLFAKVRAAEKTIRTVEVRLRYNDMTECRRSESLPEPTDLETDSYPTLARLLHRAWERRVSLRLIGLRLSGLHSGAFQTCLPLEFADAPPLPRPRRQQQLAAAVDAIRSTHGASALLRGHDLFLRQQTQPRDLLAEEPPDYLPTPRPAPARQRATPAWAALHCRSCYDFGRSTLTPEAVVQLAVERGCRAVALTDPNLHGAVAFAQAARAAGIPSIVAAEILWQGRPHLAYVQNATGYRNLCAGLSAPGRILSEEKCRGLLLRPADWLPELRGASAEDRRTLAVLEGIRTGTFRWEQERRLRPCWFPTAEEISTWPAEALRDSLIVAEACAFRFPEDLAAPSADAQGSLPLPAPLRFPEFHPPDGSTPRAFLQQLARQGAHTRYARRPSELRAALTQVEEELRVIAAVGYESYFLVTWDFLQRCAGRGISWITRGSAADSMVCYCLGISGVCPRRFELYFQRFLNAERMALHKLPDIDLDFPCDQKDAAVALFFELYGDRAAAVGGFNTFRARSAFAEAAKTLGVSETEVRKITRAFPWTSAEHLETALTEGGRVCGVNLREEPYRTALACACRLEGLPRHRKMHPCGFVLADLPIGELSPLFVSAKQLPTSHFDMDAVESLGLVKMDFLAQAGLSVLRDTRQTLTARGVAVPPAEELEPWQDPEVWDLIASGQACGVHHIESPAMSMLEKMVRPRRLDDLIAIVSVIRPGAANQLKKERFARRARGEEAPEYPHPSLEKVLASTYGVMAYEEHVLQICETFAGLGLGRSDRLRRALAKGREEEINELARDFAEAARLRGHAATEIDRVWQFLLGFRGYAFCRAHSTAYGVEAYESAWFKRYYPAEFFAAVLTHGKGFYSKLVYSWECRRLGLGFLLPDVRKPSPRYEVETSASGTALRLPLAEIKGLGQATLERIGRIGRKHPLVSLRDFYEKVRPEEPEMAALIQAGALDGLGCSRTAQFWEYRFLQRRGPDATSEAFSVREEAPDWKDITDGAGLRAEPDLAEKLAGEMELFGFPVSGHPVELYPQVRWDTYCPLTEAVQKIGQRLTVAGIILATREHRQADGRLMQFFTLGDISGTAECEVFAAAYRRCAGLTYRWPVVAVEAVPHEVPGGEAITLRVRRIMPPRGMI